MEWLGNQIKRLLEWLLDQLVSFFTWILDWLKNFVVEVLVSPVLDFVLWVVDLIPLPDWWNYGQVDLGTAGFFLSLIEFPTGMQIVLAAYVIKFTIKRIPFLN